MRVLVPNTERPRFVAALDANMLFLVGPREQVGRHALSQLRGAAAVAPTDQLGRGAGGNGFHGGEITGLYDLNVG